MRKRVLIAIAVVSSMFVGLVASANVASHLFDDVPDDHVFAQHIEWAKDNGIIFGYGDGSTFGPDDGITRSQTVAIVHRYHETFGGTGGNGEGPAGPQGDPGADGADGVDGVSGVTIPTEQFTYDDGGSAYNYLLCPPGANAIGGGYHLNTANDPEVTVVASRPQWTNDGVGEPVSSTDPDRAIGWALWLNNQSGDSVTATVWAICADLAD